MGQIVENLKSFHNGLSAGRKAGFYLVGSLLIVFLFVFSFWAGESSYKVLFRDLTPEDSVAVTKWLQEVNIPYLTQDGGATVSVPPEFTHMARMKIMAGGLIQQDVVGFEIFNKDQFGMTSFVQKLNYKRAKEGEMVRTIQSLQKVRRARVHITVPKEAVFSEDQEDAKASVFLELERGAMLTKEDIRAITNLVASSVEGLTGDAVSIVDSKGKMLKKPRSGDAIGAGAQLILDFKDDVERNVENQVTSILEKVVGRGYVEVRANADVDFTSVRTKQKKVDPNTVTPLSQQKRESVLQGKRPNPTGVPGARTEIPGAPDQGVPTVTQDVNRTLETINNIVPTTDIATEKLPGAVKRLTVAVVLDPNALMKLQEEMEADRDTAAEEEGEAKPKELDPKTKAKLEALVTSASGFNKERGDQISIEVMRFARPDLEAGDHHLRMIERREIIAAIIKFGIPSLFLFFFFMWVVRPFIKWVTSASAETVEEQLPQTIEELEASTAGSVGALAGMENLPLLEEKVDPEKAEGELIKEKLITMVEAAPEKAAQIVTEWLQEDMAKNKKDK